MSRRPSPYVYPVAAALLIAIVLWLSSTDDEERGVSTLTTAAVPATTSANGTATTGDGGPDDPTTSTDAVTVLPEPDAHAVPPVAQLQGAAVKLEPTISIANLTGMVWSVRESAYYAIAQEGLVYRVEPDLSASEVVLDLTAEVTVLQDGSERGLLGIAFDPRDGRMFLDYTDTSDDTHIASWVMRDGEPDASTRREVLFQEQPGLGHKGGQLTFDDTGNLFIAFGDGGGSRGRDAQDMGKLLGAILRIRPKLDAEGYDIPDGNPFAGTGGIKPELWAKGLRNPWRFSIDRATGDLWIGDVGEEDWEEVDKIPAGTSGQNFGWYWYEGTHLLNEGAPAGIVAPVYEYAHEEIGPAVIGGFVYHGGAIAALQGAYVFADMSGPMFAIGRDGTARLQIPDQAGGVISSFVETPEGELLVLTQRESIYRLVPA